MSAASKWPTTKWERQFPQSCHCFQEVLPVYHHSSIQTYRQSMAFQSTCLGLEDRLREHRRMFEDAARVDFGLVDARTVAIQITWIATSTRHLQRRGVRTTANPALSNQRTTVNPTTAMLLHATPAANGALTIASAKHVYSSSTTAGTAPPHADASASAP